MIELLVVTPDQHEEVHKFEADEVTIGRKPENALVLPSTSVSSRHARIYVDGGELWIEDLKSANGTSVNGTKIGVPCPLTPEDTIAISGIKIKLWRVTDPPPRHAPTTPATEPEPDEESAAAPALQPEKTPQEPLKPPPGLKVPTEAKPAKPAKPVPPAQAAPPAQPAKAAAPPRPATRASSAPPPHALPPFIPPVPKDIGATGLQRSLVVDLILKTTYYAGEISGHALAEVIKLPFHSVIEPIIAELRRDQYLDVKGGGEGFGMISLVFSVTAKAADAVRQILDRNRYTGAAPISMEAYLKLVEAQSIRRCRIPKRRLVQEFKHLIVEEAIYDGIGPALNSGKAIFFYGPPGNGKTAVCQAMVNCIDENIFIPHAIEVDGNIIKLYDDHNHKAIPREVVEQEVEFDQRYVLCRRPLIMVGGELTLAMLDMSYSPDAKYYEAPFQMKANGGILLVDDFGRQKVSPTDLLNRWIVPLESEVDFISLVTGKKLAVPFDVFVAFATNLNPEGLVDDAFLRRVRYKLEVKRPTPDQFKQIFEKACAAKEIPWNEEGFECLLELYRRDQRPAAACEPRNLLDAIRNLADYFECTPELSPFLIERAYASYFTKLKPST